MQAEREIHYWPRGTVKEGGLFLGNLVAHCNAEKTEVRQWARSTGMVGSGFLRPC